MGAAFLDRRAWLGVLLLGLLLSGCGSVQTYQAPVEDRLGGVAKPAAVGSDPAAMAAKPAPGAENAGKSGYYTVKPGDTLIRIGLDSGQSFRDIARWNNMENPNRLEVGQVVRVVPPPAAALAAKPLAPASPSPSPSAPAAPAAPTAAAAPDKPAPPLALPVAQQPVVQPAVALPASTVASGPASGPASSPGAAKAPQATPGDDEINWLWPANGPLVGGFDEIKNKGVDIGGSAGDPVLAAADGRVVYVGAGLRGYGNLIILKHNNTYLTAYAHNQALLIKEDQSVRRGQKIAEMGNSDADRVKLHFEVRRQGKPVDPIKFLPPR
ncbi:peptidase [Comamonadaceae bacterium]|nr:peptidase [Comamonadaceae bacterium]